MTTWSPLGSSVMASPPGGTALTQVTTDPGFFMNYFGFAGVYQVGVQPDPDGWVRLSVTAFVDNVGDFSTDGSLFIGANGPSSGAGGTNNGVNTSGLEFHWTDGGLTELNQMVPNDQGFGIRHNLVQGVVDTSGAARDANGNTSFFLTGHKYGLEFNPATGIVRGLIDDVVVISATVIRPVDLSLKFGLASQAGSNATLFHFDNFYGLSGSIARDFAYDLGEQVGLIFWRVPHGCTNIHIRHSRELAGPPPTPSAAVFDSTTPPQPHGPQPYPLANVSTPDVRGLGAQEWLSDIDPNAGHGHLGFFGVWVDDLGAAEFDLVPDSSDYGKELAWYLLLTDVRRSVAGLLRSDIWFGRNGLDGVDQNGGSYVRFDAPADHVTVMSWKFGPAQGPSVTVYKTVITCTVPAGDAPAWRDQYAVTHQSRGSRTLYRRPR